MFHARHLPDPITERAHRTTHRELAVQLHRSGTLGVTSPSRRIATIVVSLSAVMITTILALS
jgi:hypothetical protein